MLAKHRRKRAHLGFSKFRGGFDSFFLTVQYNLSCNLFWHHLFGTIPHENDFLYPKFVAKWDFATASNCLGSPASTIRPLIWFFCVHTPAIAAIVTLSWIDAASSMKIYPKWAVLKPRTLEKQPAVSTVQTITRNWYTNSNDGNWKLFAAKAFETGSIFLLTKLFLYDLAYILNMRLSAQPYPWFSNISNNFKVISSHVAFVCAQTKIDLSVVRKISSIAAMIVRVFPVPFSKGILNF